MLRRPLGAVLLAALVLVACSSAERGDESASPRTEPEVDETAPTGPLTVEQASDLQRVMGRFSAAMYGSSDPARVEVQLRDMQELAVQQCMESHGWEYFPNLAKIDEVRRDLFLNETGSAIADAAHRDREGYGMTYAYALGLPPEAGNMEQSNYYDGLSPEEVPVYDAQLNDCDLEARESLGLEGGVWDELNRVQTEAYDRTLGDPRLAEAEQEWRTCLAGQGLSFDAPQHIASDFDRRARALLGTEGGPEALRALLDEEILTAQKDWECQLRTTVATWMTIRAEVEQDIIDTNPDLLDQVRRQVQQVLDS
jgi:hypothetical protein